MPYGVAVNCTKCKFLTSQILIVNNKRVCADCLQKEYNTLTVKFSEKANDIKGLLNHIRNIKLLMRKR